MSLKVKNGYGLASEILTTVDMADIAIEIFYELSRGGEAPWIELKSGLVGKWKTQPSNEITYKAKELMQNLYNPANALANTDGGVILYGLEDPSKKPSTSEGWALSDSAKTHDKYRFDKQDQDQAMRDIRQQCKDYETVNPLKTCYLGEIKDLIALIEFQPLCKYQEGLVLPALVKRTESKTFLSCRVKFADGPYQAIAYTRGPDIVGNDIPIHNTRDSLPDCNGAYYQTQWENAQKIAERIRLRQTPGKVRDRMAAIRAQWNHNGSRVTICAESNHPKASEVRRWLRGSSHGKDTLLLGREEYLRSLVPALEGICGLGCCPPPKER